MVSGSLHVHSSTVGSASPAQSCGATAAHTEQFLHFYVEETDKVEPSTRKVQHPLGTHSHAPENYYFSRD